MQKHLARMRNKGLFFTGILICIMFSAFVIEAVAAPMNGEEFTLSQPDGSEVTVLIYGDELSAAAESRDGYTLVRGADGWICYAELSADGSEYVSTGVRYTDKSSAPGGRKGLRINEKSAREKRERNRKNVGDGEEESLRGFRGKFGVRAAGGNNFQPAPAPAPEDEFLPAPGDTTRVVGMVLFIAFPDYPGPTDGAFLRYADSAYNRRGFRGNGSVCDYFDRVSGGNVQYTNYITAWVTAPQPFDYYDGVDNYGRVQVLIDSALASLNRNTAVANQIASQVSTYERNWSGSIGRQKTAMALNIHPIRSGQRWSHGIWSHRGWYRNGNITVGGIRFYDYQFTGLGNSGTVTSSSTVSLGTIAHENGHMLFDWPDLYNYVSGQRNFVSTYCIMSSSGSNPQMPNPYFRSVWSAANAKAPAGWDVVTDITSMNAVLTAPANVNASYRYIRPGSNGQESYFIEARNRRSPSGTIPDSGLIIWHVHTAGDNANYDNTHTNAARRIPKVAVVQANNGSGNPGPNATFRAGSGSGKTAFNRNTTPAARWHSYTSNNAGATSPWSGEYSDINITEISAINSAANNMTFRIGSVGGPVSTPLTAAMLAIPAVTFNGSAQTPVLTVRDGSKTLVSGTDYTVTLTPRTDAGTYSVTVTGTGDYSGSASVNFVINPRALTGATVTVGGTYTYSGSALTPTTANVTVTLTGYTPTYSRAVTNNINAGTATVTVTGTGNFTGTAAGTFTILQKPLTASMLSVPAVTFNGAAQTPVLTVTDGTRTLVSGTAYTAVLTPRTNAGTYAITVTGSGNYTGTPSVNFVINKKPLTGANITLSDTSFTRTESAIEPVVVSVAVDGITADSGDYEVSYSNNVNVGTAAAVTVTAAANGNFSGSASKTFTITEAVAVLSPDRVIKPGIDADVFAPADVFAGGFTAGPNPVSRQSGTVNFFRQGSRVKTAVLTIYDAYGSVVNKIQINDNVNQWAAIRDGAAGNDGNRIIGTWDLTGVNGRPVSEGTYLVKGVITNAPDGRKEKVSLMFGVVR